LSIISAGRDCRCCGDDEGSNHAANGRRIDERTECALTRSLLPIYSSNCVWNFSAASKNAGDETFIPRHDLPKRAFKWLTRQRLPIVIWKRPRIFR